MFMIYFILVILCIVGITFLFTPNLCFIILQADLEIRKHQLEIYIAKLLTLATSLQCSVKARALIDELLELNFISRFAALNDLSMVLRRGWCGTLKRVVWYIEEGSVVL